MLISHLNCELCKVRDLLWNFFVYSAPWWTLSMYLQNEWMLSLACFFFVHVIHWSSIYWIFHASANTDQKIDLSQLRQKQTFRVLSKPQWLVCVSFCTLRTAQEGVSTKSSPHVGPSGENSPGVYTQVRQSADTSIHSQSAIAFKESSISKRTYFKKPSRCHHKDVNNSDKTF